MIIGNKINIASRRKVHKGSKLNFPRVLLDGNTVAWYDYKKADTLTVDGSNYVSRWNDRLGSGRDLIQESGTMQPLLNEDGVLFDGIDNILVCNFTWSEKRQIYAVFNMVTFKGQPATSFVFDGLSTSYNSALQEVTPPNGIRAVTSAGNLSSELTSIPIATYGIVMLKIKGAESLFIANNSQATFHSGILNTPTGFILGARYNLGNPSNIKIKEVILRKDEDSQGDSELIINYLKKKYAL